MIDINEIRKRAWHYLTPEISAEASMTLDQLKQFIGGTFSHRKTSWSASRAA
jgi:hypothetical protein